MHMQPGTGSSRSLKPGARSRSIRPSSVRAALVAVAFVWLMAPRAVSAQALTAAAHDEPLPEALAPAIRDALGPGGVRVVRDALAIDFWWVKALAVKTGGEVDWLGVAEGSLVGAARLSGEYRDIRGRAVKAGVYTLRYAIQPANGDHLGVSSYQDFLLMSPAADDTDPPPAGHLRTVDMSRRTVGATHPAPWALDPPVTDEPLLSVGRNDMDLTYVVFELPTTAGPPLRFALVLIGRIEG
jgi:hypothetical protein